MIKTTLKKIEETLKTSPQLEEKQKLELKILLKRLEGQIEELSQNKKEPPHLLKETIDDIKKSVDEFESSHPDLVSIVNNISNTLSNMGI